MTRPFEVIPAIDLRAGATVNLVQGDYARETVFDADPAGRAKSFIEAGARRLHVVDLDGARDGQPRNEAAIQAILAAAGDVPVQLGGGVRSLDRIEALLGMGLDRVILGTLILEDPGLVSEAARRHPQRVVAGLDTRAGRLAVRGWRETSELEVEQVLERFSALPLAAVLHTDIERDGMLHGPNLEATARLARSTALPVIASGGVSSVADLVALARTRVIAAAVVGRALYTGAIDLAAALEEIARC